MNGGEYAPSKRDGRGTRSDRGFDAILALIGIARAHGAPVGQRSLRTLRCSGRHPGRRVAAVIHIVVRILIEVGRFGKILARQSLIGAFAGGILSRRFRRLTRNRRFAVVTLQQRIALQLLLAIFGQFEVR